MATALTFRNASPYSLVYSMTSTDGAATPIAAATLIGDTVPGPLRALLTQFDAGGKLDHLNLEAAGPGIESMGRVRIRHEAEAIAGVQTQAALRHIFWTAHGLSIQATAGSNNMIEIRLAHSMER
jgi:hypothetical protein